jgi:hypothetical protein
MRAMQKCSRISARGGTVLEFFYEMDSGSKMFIQTVVSDLYRKKVEEAVSSPT